MKTNNITPEQLLSRITSITSITPEQLRSESRFKEVSLSRHVFVYLMREHGYVYREIGLRIGNRTPATLIHSVSVVRNGLECGDKRIINLLKSIEEYE